MPSSDEVGEAVDLEELADLLDRAVVGDQLFAGGEIDAVEARVTDRRAAHAEVDFLRAGAAEGPHLRARRRAADDGVFDDHDAACPRRRRG